MIKIGEAPWDRLLTKDEVFRLKPKDKQARTALSFKRKLALLRQAIDKPVLLLSLDQKDYRSRAAFRRWENEQYGLWRWSDPAVDDPEGPNAELEKQRLAHLSAIDVLRQGKHFTLKKALDAKDLVIADLERQICDLMDQIGILHVRLASREVETR